MYKSAGPPVVGGLVRSGLGTRLARVLHVLPNPSPHYVGSWVCCVQQLGHLVGTRWRPPGRQACNRQPTWLAVHPNARQGWHAVRAVAPRPGMPV
jgi:hypothetical protein